MALVERTDEPDEAAATVAADSPRDAVLPPSKLSPSEQFRVLKGWFRADADHTKKWRIQARDDFAFRAGEQLSADDKRRLDEQERPHIVFNRVLTILKAVAGMEINGRHEIHFLPRGTEDTAANEVLSAASKWMADMCDGEDEESQAFEHCCTCGIGVVENRMSYEEHPEGLYVEECFDPREFYWDRTAKKKNLSDARRRARLRRMPIGDAAQMFPGKTREELDAVWAETSEGDARPKSIEDKRRRDSDDSSELLHDDQVEVSIVQIQWWEREAYWLVADKATNSKVEMTEAEYQRLASRMQQLGMDVQAVRLTRKVYKQAFLGGELLQKATPAPIKGRFSWDVITGEYDAVEGTWFGLVKPARDPQMWANKWLSQVLHILNSTAKGGILAEASAFDDQREAEEGYAQPEVITWLADGALSGDKPKIMPKPGSGQVADYVNLLQFAVTSVRDVLGVNLELLGQQDMNQPGVVEMMRKQAGMTVLATLFDSLRRFRKGVGRSRLFFCQTYLSDGRLIRVAGPDSVQAVALAREKTAGDYDVVIDDTPTSPNQKEANWAIIQPLLGVFKEQLMANPEIFAMLLEYSPLPSRIVEAIKGFVKKAQNDQKAIQEAEEQKQLGKNLILSEVEKNLGAAEASRAKAGVTQVEAQANLAEAQAMLRKGDLEGLAGQLDAMEAAARVRKIDAEAGKAENAGRAALITAAAKVRSDTETAAAKVRASDEDVAAKRVGMMIDHITAIPKAARDLAAAKKDMASARQIALGKPAAPAKR